MQKNIAVDIDEVLSPFHELFLRHHNNYYGTSFSYPDPQGRYFLEQFTGESSEIVEAKIYQFLHNALFEDLIVPLPGAYDALCTLKDKGCTLQVVTARGPEFREATEYFLDRNFPQVFSAMYAIPSFVGAAMKPTAGKIDICGEIGAAYLIDDNLSTAMAAAEAGIGAIVFGDYHWNTAKNLPIGVTRCKDWSVVVQYFNER